MASLHIWRRDFLQDRKLSPAFVNRFAALTSKATHVWELARKEDNFALFAPCLEKIVHACQKKAELLGYTHHPYDALLNAHEPGMTVAEITPLFAELKTELIHLIKKIKTAAPIDKSCAQQEFSHDTQMHFGHAVLDFMGIKKDNARLDLSRHPFCATIHPRDTRLASRIFPNNVLSNIFSTLHEGGHALYCMQMQESLFGTPLAQSLSYGMDESQSRWWETFVGKSFAFWQYFFPLMQNRCEKLLGHITLDEFYLAANAVIPSTIRLEADEVTYSLHIILRFEIEKGLIEGSLKVKDIPRLWKEKTEEYLGVIPLSHRDGSLQDIHWSLGSFGYFPLYALGNIYAAQLFAAFEKQHPLWKKEIAEGNTKAMREWLREHVHMWGRRFSPKELLAKVGYTGISTTPYLSYLQRKYHALYHLDK